MFKTLGHFQIFIVRPCFGLGNYDALHWCRVVSGYNITLALAHYFDYYKKKLHSYYIEEETWSDVGASTPHFTKTGCLHQNTGAL
jgi:hypothetical protein